MELHKSIKLSFITVRHTKFSLDWCFSLLKQKFCWTKVDCLDDMEFSAAINQSGETVVPTFKWAEVLSSFLKRVPKRLHHFQFTSEDLGTVIVKQEERLDLMAICGGLPWASSSKWIEWWSSVVLVSKYQGILFGSNKGHTVSPAILPPNICNFFGVNKSSSQSLLLLQALQLL